MQKAMEVFRVQVLVMSILGVALAFAVPSINAAEVPAPAPAPGPTSDGMQSSFLFPHLMIITLVGFVQILIGFAEMG